MITKQRKPTYEIFGIYGREHVFLADDEAITADFDTRIKSIWPFLTTRVKTFEASLRARDRANFDCEDVFTELWVALRENDKEWKPERGKYLTYAGVIIDRELCAIRDRARTVHSPKNSSSRMREYEQESADGTISARRAKTRDDIRRTSDGIVGFGVSRRDPETGAEKSTTEQPCDVAAGREERTAAIEALQEAISRVLTPDEASVLGRTSGLWGRDEESAWYVAFTSGRDADEVRRVRQRALNKVRDYLLSIGKAI